MRQEDDERAGLDVCVPAHVRFFKPRVLRENGQGAAVGHRVPRVDAEIEQHLMNLRGVAVNRPEVRIDVLLKLNRLGKRLANHFLQVRQKVPELNEFVLALNAASKGKDLLHQLGAAPGAAVEHIKHVPVGQPGDVLPQHRHSHHDGREHIVQVVRDAAGQHADVFQALGTEELSLQFFLLGDVGVDDEDGFRPALIVVHQRPAAFHDDFRRMLGHLVQFPFPLAFRDQTLQRFHLAGGIVLEEEFVRVLAERFCSSRECAAPCP